jgi:hypothetical protein
LERSQTSTNLHTRGDVASIYLLIEAVLDPCML